MKRAMALLLTLCIAWAVGALAETDYWALPDCFTVTHVKTRYRDIAGDVNVYCTYPKTVLPEVTEALRACTDALADALDGELPREDGATLDVGSQVTFSGRNTVSFLTTASVIYDREQLAAKVSASVYDMETGRKLSLSDIVTAEGLEYIAGEARRQLDEYFPAEAANPAKLDVLTTMDRLADVDFTMSVSRLRLHYAANVIYKDKTTLMHVTVYYKDIEKYLSEEGRERTDNSGYRLLALTFDDGPALARTLRLLDVLRKHNATVTFFIIGTRIEQNRHVIAREHDAGHTVASHNWEHVYKGVTPDNVITWKNTMQSTLEDLIGVAPPYMRAPGGLEAPFIDGNVGMPLINWSLVSGDANTPELSADIIYRFVLNAAGDGCVVLMHDINTDVHDYTSSITEFIVNKEFLMVSVDELMAARGVELLPNVVYYSAPKLF